MYYGRTATIEELLCVSTASLKRLGFLRPRAYCSGVLEWKHGDHVTGRAGVAIDTRGEVPTIRFAYNFNGTPVDYTALLRYTPSNLNRGGYYYFACPVTGRSCRKLYLVGGRFVSRYAFRAVYDRQTKSRAQRSGLYAYLDAVSDFEKATKQKGRKMFYRDKITPYGLKVERLAAKVQRMGAAYEAAEQVKRSRREKSADSAALWD